MHTTDKILRVMDGKLGESLATVTRSTEQLFTNASLFAYMTGDGFSYTTDRILSVMDSSANPASTDVLSERLPKYPNASVMGSSR